MKISSIIHIADSINETYGHDLSSPAQLCRDLGIILLYFPMGYGKAACKGFILHQADNTAITISSDIDKTMQQIVLYHELAHYFLHIRTGIAETMQDFSVGSPASEMEYEADMLAAELSLADKDVMEALSSGLSFFDAAASLNTLPEILDFKLRTMRERGYLIPDAPINTTSGFLGRVGTSA